MTKSEIRMDHVRPGRFAIPTLKHVSVGPAALRGGSPASLGDLDNPIIPLFRKSNFPGWNYQVIEPALRLASRLLDTPCLLDFLHAVLHGEEQDLPHPDAEGVTYKAFFRTKSSLSAMDVANVRLYLSNLAEMVQFNLVLDLGSGGMTSTVESGYVDPTFSSHIKFFHGFRQCIDFDLAMYERLCSGEGYEYESFLFADLLCHEVMHAVLEAQEYGEHMPFEYNLAAEIGYEWSNHMWGGTLAFDYGITDWPAPATVLKYRHKDWPLTALQEPKRSQVCWDIGEFFVEKLFTNHFWDVEVPIMGAAALKPGRDLGWLVKVLDNGGTEKFDSCSNFQTGLEGVPTGYKLNLLGQIVPREFWEQEDRSSRHEQPAAEFESDW